MRLTEDYQTHVFTCTYTADVSGVCSAMYELGGMSVLHDPSGCNSTYSTHDEPRWYDTDSLMFVSGLDEMTAVMGDDSVLRRDVAAACRDLHPRFITLCGASIPHIIAFDYRGNAHLIEEETGIPVLPVPTDGLKSYVSGVGMALEAFLQRFADPALYTGRSGKVNLVGVTPLDFSVNGNAEALRRTFEEAGIPVNCCMAMGETFEAMQRAYEADVNVVVSSAGRRAARFMQRKAGIPRVEGLPVGEKQTAGVLEAVRATLSDGKDRRGWQDREMPERYDAPEGCLLIIGEEIFARSMAEAVNSLPPEKRCSLEAFPYWPDVDEGLPERELVRAMRGAAAVMADPLYRVVPGVRHLITFPHEAYSGRMYRRQIPVFAGKEFRVEELLRGLSIE